MATKNPQQPAPGTTDEPMFFERLLKIARTGGLEAAVLTENRRESHPIKPEEQIGNEYRQTSDELALVTLPNITQCF